ncbi:S-methyl-5'-thioinosine phosphorylase [Caldichromatium japonicum]|uniref:Probable S-methyl-5'-thioinosine phosphorylase n=1 Tax=Caldichromatium japonicum TaxID=2699430 RepID=A0A6G7VEA1_9GAMM|nr:S-methyl-5'-thioinosine phosphorylase [Caldichromatium japonicum]QIK38403.1 S-methyl-5'-thioinosine phosphorylase [Caldichromatium japonicum]
MGLLAIIGGSGFTSLPGLVPLETLAVETPYGATSASLIRGELGRGEILFLPRHGADHRLPPHGINYRANLWALRAAGAEWVIGLAAVGGITPLFAPQVLAVPDQIIDYTYGRAHTFYDGTSEGVEHVDFTEPYCESLRQALIQTAARLDEPLIPRGTYGATQGPRLESAAEILRCEQDGCDMVGMTGMPEAALARELGLCYACLAFVVNWAAGKSGSVITMKEIEENLGLCVERVLSILKAVAARV